MDQPTLVAQRKAAQDALNQAEAAIVAAMRESKRIMEIDCSDEEHPDPVPLLQEYWKAIDQCTQLNMQYQCDRRIEQFAALMRQVHDSA